MSKIAIITGGGSGIGEAIAKVLSRSGIQSIILDVNNDTGERVVSELLSEGNEASYYNCDISDQNVVKRTLLKIVNKFGPPDILINNAGIAHIGKADDTSEDDFDKIIKVNVRGAYNMVHETIPHMKKNGGGIIVNMVSVAATVAVPNRFAYTVSKGAMMGMTLSIAKDYLEDNIRCNSVSPARIHTPFVDNYIKSNFPGEEEEVFDRLSKTQPIGRMGTPEDVASFVQYLCSDAASFLTGCDYPIDGGFIKLNT